jgi:hypothetical protein
VQILHITKKDQIQLLQNMQRLKKYKRNQKGEDHGSQSGI